MSEIIAKIQEIDDEFNADYNIEDELSINIYNCTFDDGESSQVDFKDILLKDLKSCNFYYSPLFYYAGEQWSLVNYYKYNSNFYFHTSNPEYIKDLNKNIKIKSITSYNPMLIHYFTNPCLIRQYEDGNKKLNYSLILKEADKKILNINSNNIEKIELSGIVRCKDQKSHQNINIETENYIKIYFVDSIGYEDLLAYINELDVFVNAYCPMGLCSYKTTITTENDCHYNFYHKLLGKETYYQKGIHKPVNLNFFEYLEHMYKTIDYRTSTNKNKFLPLDFKKPTSLEDKFVYYFRFIDMFVGKKLFDETGRKQRTHKRIKYFLENYTNLFSPHDISDIDILKNEINGLRSHYIHEGYYLVNNQFEVTNDDGSKYLKDIDYDWLYRITKSFKLGTYIILYKEILGLDINESELKICCGLND